MCEAVELNLMFESGFNSRPSAPPALPPPLPCKCHHSFWFVSKCGIGVEIEVIKYFVGMEFGVWVLSQGGTF